MSAGLSVAKFRIVDVAGEDFASALRELVAVCNPTLPKEFTQTKLCEAIINQEQTMPTCLGNGLILPHLRLNMRQPYICAIGRCKNGLPKESQDCYRETRLIFLLLSSLDEKAYLNNLATLARVFQSSSLLESDYLSWDLETFRSHVSGLFKYTTGERKGGEKRSSNIILKECVKIARSGQCDQIMLFGDTFAHSTDWSQHFSGCKVILVTQKATEVSTKGGTSIVPVRLFSRNRLSQLRSAIIIALMHGVIKPDERLCCVGGVPGSNHLDSLMIVNVSQEIQSVLGLQIDILPKSIRPEVFERLLGIVTELAIEGREGRSVGGLFVLGNSQEIRPYIKPLVLNPFYGYKEEDRNILNPFMDETIKEYSSIDGAFIIRGDGVLESAGSMLYAPPCNVQLPSGLGTRHAVAAAITVAVDCVAFTISASTGQVSLFRKGHMVPLM